MFNQIHSLRDLRSRRFLIDGQRKKKMGLFDKLKERLQKTREQISGGMDNLINGYAEIDDDFYEELEENLIMSDMGMDATEEILNELQKQVRDKHIRVPADTKELLIEIIKERMALTEDAYEFKDRKSVVLVVGVNGVGKTTTCGKLASSLKAQGKRVILCAADTFRAAATEQLKEWSDRAGVEIITGNEGGDPGSVIYDGVSAAKARGADVLICDTAGRLNNKKNLMEELRKINNIISREYPDACRETLVVLDSTTGQNALSQAKEFKEVTDVTGIVLTKLDGTAKGGIAVAIKDRMGVPVKYIGVGEGIDDLEPFDPDAYVRAIFA